MRGMMTGVANKFKSGPSLKPDDIQNLELWMDGNSGYVDLSSNASTISGTNSAITVGALNGQDSFSYNDTGYNNLTPTVTDPSELYFVVVYQGNNASRTVFAHRSESNRLIQFNTDNGNSNMQTRGSAASLSTTTASDTATDWGIREYYFSEVEQSVITPTASSTDSNSFVGQSFDSTQWTIGGFNTGSFSPNFFGEIAFIALYSVKPTDDELTGLRSYLKNRYAL